jgi:hypothetical protein
VVDHVDVAEQGRDRRLGEVGFDQAEPGTAAQPGQVGLLGGAGVVAGEAVDPDHLVAGVKQGQAQPRAEEPGRPPSPAQSCPSSRGQPAYVAPISTAYGD